MTRLIADELKQQIKAFDHTLGAEIVKGEKSNHYNLVITATVFPRYILDMLFQLISNKAYYIKSNEELRGHIDFVIY